jgi:hypothetical protein
MILINGMITMLKYMSLTVQKIHLQIIAKQLAKQNKTSHKLSSGQKTIGSLLKKIGP